MFNPLSAEKSKMNMTFFPSACLPVMSTFQFEAVVFSLSDKVYRGTFMSSIHLVYAAVLVIFHLL